MGDIVSGTTDLLGLTDTKAAKTAQQNSEYIQQQILSRLDQVGLPDINLMEIDLEDPELVGLLEEVGIPASAIEQIQTDPALRGAQLEALEGLRNRAEEGLTSEDRMMMDQLLDETSAQGQAREQSLLQGMARRGTLDSGMQLAAALQGQQSDAQNAQNRAMQMAAQAGQNRMKALEGMANRAQQIEGTDFNSQLQAAQARDVIARANAENRQRIGEQNLAARQNIADRRVANKNQEEMFNKGLIQQDFQNRMTKAGAQNQAQGNLASMYANQSQNIAANNAGTMQGLISGAATVMKPPSDIKTKVNIKSGDSSVEEMLDSLSPYEYDYKPEYVEDSGDIGKQMGVMAQDLEQSPLGKEFVAEDMNGTKRVDYGKMGSTQMAALVNLHNRLKKIEGR